MRGRSDLCLLSSLAIFSPRENSHSCPEPGLGQTLWPVIYPSPPIQSTREDRTQLGFLCCVTTASTPIGWSGGVKQRATTKTLHPSKARGTVATRIPALRRTPSRFQRWAKPAARKSTRPWLRGTQRCMMTSGSVVSVMEINSWSVTEIHRQ